MNQNPLTSEQLNNAYFNLLTPQQNKWLRILVKICIAILLNTRLQKTTTSTPLNDEEEIEWLVRQIMSGLQLCDINTKGKKLLRKNYGKTWKSKLF